ncbi:hypothetical protein FR264_07850 [Vibrio vulnificus]|nr:hypothetical protein [Vibrio vulnificus]
MLKWLNRTLLTGTYNYSLSAHYKAKSYEAQQTWANIAKKYNGLGLTGISMAYGAFALMNLDMANFALCTLC